MNGVNQPLFDRLEVLDDPTPRPAALNMALDEVLLGGLGTVPLLRIYRWAQPSVSFGYFTPWETLAGRYPGRDFVRRWTGGGIVEHGLDLTYSLFIPRSHALSNGHAGSSYCLIHCALRLALQRTGQAHAQLAENPAEISGLAAQPCFASPVRHDLLAGDRKIGGGAQRRTRGGLLHQGSVLIEADPESVVAQNLAAALPTAFGEQTQPRALRPDEIRAAERLAREKYATEAWLRRL